MSIVKARDLNMEVVEPDFEKVFREHYRIQKLRSMKSPATKVPAIALTSYAGDEDRRLSIETGFTTHISKPITLTELIRVIRRLTAERGAA